MNIDCFIPCNDSTFLTGILPLWRAQAGAGTVHLLVTHDFAAAHPCPDGCRFMPVGDLRSSDTMRQMARNAATPYIIYSPDLQPVVPQTDCIRRMTDVASATHSTIVYADYRERDASPTSHSYLPHPVIDYRPGSIRDDFDFGKVVVIATDGLKRWATAAETDDYRYAGWYSLRLFLSREKFPFHLRECLYTAEKTDYRTSGEQQFDYVDPRNAAVQQEMEQVATEHLRSIGALISTEKRTEPDFDSEQFPCEASVIIPVFNREKTIADAIGSALRQQTDFRYNIIVVDNHSTDSTTEIIRQHASDPRVVHLIPDTDDLGIGGCWNLAIDSPQCGRFAVQLDSDDLYSSPLTLQRIVDTFRREKAGMVIGSYGMYDFNLNPLPPGLIDHREWTDENGPNNALRINGLGAPRAFYTPIVRAMHFPNTSYGEDYATAIAISRRYRIARIYDELYQCRRWTGNSDADLSQERINRNNAYKDQIRTIEIAHRMAMNANLRP